MHADEVKGFYWVTSPNAPNVHNYNPSSNLQICIGEGKLPCSSTGSSLNILYDATPIGLFDSLSAYSTVVFFLSLHRMIPIEGFSPSRRTLSSTELTGHTDVELALQVILALVHNYQVMCPSDFCNNWLQFYITS